MAKSTKKTFFSNGDIIFDSVAYDCEVDMIHPEKGVVKNIIRLYPKDGKHSYVYKDGKELISIKADSTTGWRAVLPDLLAIRDNKDIKNFVERHGYPFPTEPNKGTSLESAILFSFIHRLDATLNLMSALDDGGTDHKKILALTLYLLLTPRGGIEFTNGWESFCTCDHEINYVWNNPNMINERILCQEDENYNIGEGCYVEDSVRPPNTFLDTGEYYEATNYGQFDRQTVKNIATYLFRNATQVGSDCRLAIDFLFHFSKDVGDIFKYNYKGELIFGENSPPTDSTFNDKFDKQLEVALAKLAKRTLQAEIEWNSRGVEPSYNTETLTSAWRVHYLLSGIYFSLFNIHAQREQYRICAKHNCGCYFLAKINSVKQKYCSKSCANATAQRVYRSKTKM